MNGAPADVRTGSLNAPEGPRPRILFITHLDVWTLTAAKGVKGAGNQSMYNTLLGYADAGYDVDVLTTSTALGGMDQVGPHITIHRIPIPLYDWIQRRRTRRAGRTNTVPGTSDDHAVAGAAATPPQAARSDGAAVAAAGSTLAGGQSVRFWLVFQWGALLAAWKLTRRGRYSVLYGYEVIGAPTAFLLARLLRIPCVTRFQGTELAPLIARPLRLFRLHWTFVLSYALPADLVVMANDGTEGDRMLRFVRQDPRRSRFWMNGVDKSRVLRPHADAAAIRRALSIPDDAAMILTTCRMVGWKRIDRGLRALAAARARTDRFVYVIVGEGPMRGEYEKLAGELGLTDRVRFLGSLPHERVMDYLNVCDIYLSTYDLSNLGNPLIEATVCGRCIVTLDVGATRDLITHDVNGVMLPPDDASALADRLATLIERPAERARLAAGAAARAASLDTWAERMKREVGALLRLTCGRAARIRGAMAV